MICDGRLIDGVDFRVFLHFLCKYLFNSAKNSILDIFSQFVQGILYYYLLQPMITTYKAIYWIILKQV